MQSYFKQTQLESFLKELDNPLAGGVVTDQPKATLSITLPLLSSLLSSVVIYASIKAALLEKER